MNEMDFLFCLRCKERLEYTGKKRLHAGDNWGVIGNIGELMVEQLSLDMYVCPQCGRVEFFADKTGKASWPH